MTTYNPWNVDSIQDFSFLKCPECPFDAKAEDIFQNHAIENHPLSFVLFGGEPLKVEIKKEFSYDPLITDEGYYNNYENTYSEDQKPVFEEDFKDEKNLVEDKVHERKKPFKCGLCDYAATLNGNLTKHIKAVHEGILVFHNKCATCKEKFEDKISLDAHIETVHDGKKPYSCSICNKQFDRKFNMTSHIRIVHEGQLPFTCSSCDKSFSTRTHLKRHILGKKNLKCTFSLESMKLKYPLSSEPEDTSPAICSVCGKTFGSKKLLRKHVAKVHEKKIIGKCPTCDKAFRHKDNLQRHIESVHEGKKYLCSICSSESSTKNALKRHVEVVHEGKRPYLCTICGADFSQRPNLKRHIEGVHEKKQHACTLCEKIFSDSGNLKKHIKMKHEEGSSEESEKKKVSHLCVLCGLKFTQRGNLVKHIKSVHDKSMVCSCDTCGSKFSTKYTLKAHIMAVHEGIKPKPGVRKPKSAGNLKSEAASLDTNQGHEWSHPLLGHFKRPE